MKKPYIICHMMTSADGWIDCAMTSQLPGVDDYYETPDALKVPTTLSGRVTAKLEMAEQGKFKAADMTPFGREGFSKKSGRGGLWGGSRHPRQAALARCRREKPYLIITCEQVPKEYLRYLNGKNISWIACGGKRVNLARAAQILQDEFGVERMGVVGGAVINTAFLDAGLLDEISILIGAGIDGRAGLPSVYDGRKMGCPLTQLTLSDVQRFDSGAVWLRYKTE